MPKMTPEQRAELEAQLAADDAADDDETYEVDWWEETPDGKRRGGRMPWAQGKKVFGSWLPDLFGDKPPAAAAPGKTPSNPGAKPEEGDPPPAGTVRFGRRTG
jgi:hypothetical protein